MNQWTQEQREKAHELQQEIGRAIHFSKLKLTQPLNHELMDELACQRNELLEALKAFVEEWDELVMNQLAPCYPKAVAAIAKAEGEK